MPFTTMGALFFSGFGRSIEKSVGVSIVLYIAMLFHVEEERQAELFGTTARIV